MAEKILRSEIQTMIANEIKNIGLSEVLDEETIKKIEEMIVNSSKKVKELQEQEQEAIEVTNQTFVPEPEKTLTQPIQNNDISISKTNETDYVPQLPSFVQKMEPEKFFIFSDQELSHGVESLTNAKFRLVNNPDQKTCIKEVWLSEGKTKAEVFMVEFNKIGELTFDPFNGTTKFVEMKNFEKENPFQPKMAVNSNEPIFEYRKADNGLKMKEIVTSAKYFKINTPEDLKESIRGNSNKAILMEKNSEVQIWKLDEKEYYLPSEIISLNKCYIKK